MVMRKAQRKSNVCFHTSNDAMILRCHTYKLCRQSILRTLVLFVHHQRCQSHLHAISATRHTISAMSVPSNRYGNNAKHKASGKRRANANALTTLSCSFRSFSNPSASSILNLLTSALNPCSPIWLLIGYTLIPAQIHKRTTSSAFPSLNLFFISGGREREGCGNETNMYMGSSTHPTVV